MALLTPGAPAHRPTLNDVAAAADVSRSTVSRVVNHDPVVGREARERVERAIEALGYTPHLPARALALRRGDTLQIITADEPGCFTAGSYYGRVLHGLVAAAGRTGLRVALRVAAADRLAAEIAEADQALGILLINVTAEALHGMDLDHTRVMSLGISAPGVPYLDPDNAGGARSAVDHLLTTGRTRIGMIAGPVNNSCAITRLSGYLDRMRETGHRPLVADGEFCAEPSRRAVGALLDAEPRLDAIFAGCDESAAGALQELAARGIKVPDDVAVVGFDDSVIALTTAPPLTTVRQPVEEMATTAAVALVEGEVRSGWSVILPTTLVVRDSA